MNRGEKLWVRDAGDWVEATYEFRVTQGEPLGHHSVMLANGGGRRVVCGCCTSTEPVKSRWAEAFIEHEQIVIRVPVAVLPDAIEQNPRDFGGHHRFAKHITNLTEFGKDVVRALNADEEDGTTLVHTLFDDATAMAIDNGSLNVDYDAAERVAADSESETA